MLWNWYTIDSCMGNSPSIPSPETQTDHHQPGFLTESWHIGSNGAFAATCIGTILLVMAMEALRRLGKEYDDWILRGFQARAASTTAANTSSKSATKTTVIASDSTGLRTVVFRASPLQQAVRAVLHAISLGVAYIVMLLVMSFNGYLIICVIIGGGLGKFFCDWMTRQMVVQVETGDVGSEESSAGIEEPSVCCG